MRGEKLVAVNIKDGTEPTKNQLSRLNSRNKDKYIEHYHCAKISQLMSTGKSPAYACKELKISRSTLNRWLNNYPKFKESYDMGLNEAQSWWEDRAMEIVASEKADPSITKMITFILQKRFRNDYGDSKQFHVIKDNEIIEMSDDEIDNKIKQRIKELQIRDFTGKSIIDVTPVQETDNE